jgi:hypothetical protein
MLRKIRVKDHYTDMKTNQCASAPVKFLKAMGTCSLLLSGMAANVYSQANDPGLHIEGRFLVDGNGQKVVFRGPELVYRWGVYSGITDWGVDVPWEGGKNNNAGSATIREIGKTKASAMRILGGIGNELDDLLNTAVVEQKMYVSVVRVDWKNAQMKATLQKYAKYIILHPRGEFTHRDANLWRTEALKVVKEIRALGYTSVIEIGTTGYGQTWSTLKSYGEEVAASDPLKKTMFLLQLYSEYAKDVNGTLDQLVAFPVPVISDACLFTSTYGNTSNTYKEVWEESSKRDISSFYWDWYGDGEGNSMTSNGQYSSLNAIGKYIVNDSPAALKNTVKGAYILNAPNGATISILPRTAAQIHSDAGVKVFDVNGKSVPDRLLLQSGQEATRKTGLGKGVYLQAH